MIHPQAKIQEISWFSADDGGKLGAEKPGYDKTFTAIRLIGFCRNVGSLTRGSTRLFLENNTFDSKVAEGKTRRTLYRHEN